MKILIEKRITDLKSEKEELLKEYPNTSADMQDVLAERNMRISLELKFLNELSQACVSGSLPLIDMGSSYEDLGKDAHIKYHCPRCEERVYYPDDCRKCFKEIIWRGNDR